MDALEQHFLGHFNVKLTTMALTRVGTYCAFVGGEGRIKVRRRKCKLMPGKE